MLNANALNKFLFIKAPVDYLRRKGATVGEGCRIYMKEIGSEPYLLTIGNHVSIGNGVELLTHDGAVWVLRELQKNHELDWFAPVTIGNNVFISNGVKVLPGVSIGDNVIIGANSVVTKSLASNKVYAGAPAKEVSDIIKYSNKKLPDCVETKTMSADEKQRFLSN